MVEKLEIDRGGRIVTPDNELFNFREHTLAFTKVYQEPETNHNLRVSDVTRYDYSGIIDRDAFNLGRANQMDYFLIFESETVHRMLENADLPDLRFSGHKRGSALVPYNIEIMVYTANFYVKS